MQRISLIFCILLMVLAPCTACYAEEHGRGGGHERGGRFEHGEGREHGGRFEHGEGREHGERHEHGEGRGHGGFGVFIEPFPYPGYPACERECRDRVVPVCRYDYWGERWCHDEVVRDCRWVCY